MTEARTERAVAAPRPPRRIGRVHWLGVATLIRRETGRFFQSWTEAIAGPALTMVLYLTVFALALGPAQHDGEGAAVLRFMLPGLVLFATINVSAELTVFSIVFDKLEGSIADILMAPLTPAELTFGYALAGAAAGLIVGLPLLAIAMLLYGLPVRDPLLLAAFWGLSALMLALVGVLAALWARKWDHVGAFFGFFLIPVTFLSGLFAPIEGLPEPLRLAVQVNPIHYALDGFRAAAIGVHSAPVWLSLTVVAGTVLALWLLCNRLIRRGWRLKA